MHHAAATATAATCSSSSKQQQAAAEGPIIEHEMGSTPLKHLWGIKFDDGYTTDFTAMT